MRKLKLNELDSTVKSSYRTMAIFEFFAEIKRPATVAEISDAVQIPQSSTSAIIKSLLETSFLSYDIENRTYEPTMRLAFLSDWSAHKNANAAQVPSVLKKLGERIQETTVLALRNGIYSQYIFVSPVDGVLGRHVETGSVRPLISSATGWSLLKDESDFEIGKLIRRTRHEIKDPLWQGQTEDVLKNIANAREKGYALSAGQFSDDVGGIAVNLPTVFGGASLAIAAAGPKARILGREQEIADRLKTVAEEMPRRVTREILGHR
ncbi:MAG: helix-turn-helix domain-containing protein [Hellea sp.]